MILNYKYRLYPDQEQESKLDQQFFVANQSWNHALSIRIAEIKEKNGLPRRMGYPSGGKITATVQGEANHEFVQDMTAWKQAVIEVVKLVKADLNQLDSSIGRILMISTSPKGKVYTKKNFLILSF